MKEIVKTLEVSGKLTFPISLKQPGPRDSLLQCYIKRNRSNQTYYLYLSLDQPLNEDGKFLLAARKLRRPTCTDYIISLNPDDMSKGSSTYIGKLSLPNAGSKVMKSRSYRLVNFKQVSLKVPAGNYPAVHISYKLNVLGRRGPRRMQCVMDGIPASSIEPGGVAPTQTEFMSSTLETFPSFFFCRSKLTHVENLQSGRPLSALKDGMLVLKNKLPRWHEQLQYWCLNFHGRVTVTSLKNFQLVASPEQGVIGPDHENVILWFGKVGKDVFTMDYQYPISAFQAFAICLSSFDTRIACVARRFFLGRDFMEGIAV
ncbi:hypothetical protein NL676_023412 [Syzygium grande]|nr:hypothetical protein NL676_023412 [Syzygium grande]